MMMETIIKVLVGALVALGIGSMIHGVVGMDDTVSLTIHSLTAPDFPPSSGGFYHIGVTAGSKKYYTHTIPSFTWKGSKGMQGVYNLTWRDGRVIDYDTGKQFNRTVEHVDLMGSL
jgi:hypothetical protein